MSDDQRARTRLVTYTATEYGGRAVSVSVSLQQVELGFRVDDALQAGPER